MTADPRRTPLFENHRALGARFVAFAGWEMPLSYAGIGDEHLAVLDAMLARGRAAETALAGLAAALLIVLLSASRPKRNLPAEGLTG